MELKLQFGYGMMEHCRALLSAWEGGTAILSPRDLSSEQLERLSSTISRLPNATVLLDPQFYLPHANHERLRSHDYWPKDYETSAFFGGPALTKLLADLAALNSKLMSCEFILPGIIASSINDDWIEVQRAVIDEARSTIQNMPLVGTIALSAEAVRDQDQLARLLDHAERWNLPGYYLVCEHPKGQYLVDDAIWVANVLDIATGLRLTGARVTFGYCNHQMLAACVSHVNAIASGTWMNVRMFPPEKFQPALDEEIKQRTTWYYCPQALSEYKIPFLDVAAELGLLDSMAPPQDLDGGYASTLFSGAQPSSVSFTEQMAFRHYLHCLRGQASQLKESTFDATRDLYLASLDTAEATLRSLASNGIRGQLREFKEIIDVNRAAVELFTKRRGSVLRRKWRDLQD